MSSSYVRTAIKSFIATNLPTETVIDLTGEYGTIEDILTDEGLDVESSWLGLQFDGGDELPVSLHATNDNGCYREIGIVSCYVVAAASPTAVDSILTRAETLRDTFRGRRIGDMIVDGVTPPNFNRGATLDFESGFISASVIISYTRDLNL